MRTTSQLSRLLAVGVIALLAATVTACAPSSAAAGSTGGEDSDSVYDDWGNPAPDEGEGDDYCDGSEEGMYNCANDGDGNSGDGSGDGSSDTDGDCGEEGCPDADGNDGDGTDGNDGDGSGTGGDTPWGGECPEDGCPTADGSGGSTGTGVTGGTTDGDGSGGTEGGDGTGDGVHTPWGGDCPEDGCPTADGTGDNTGTGVTGGTSDGTGGGDGTGRDGDGDCGEEGCPDGDGGDGGDGDGDGDGDDGDDDGDGGDDGDGDGDGGDGTTPDGDLCTAEHFVTEAGAMADLLLVIDRSNSMTEPTMSSPTSKWQQLQSVITDVTADLEGDIGFGLALFPMYSACGPGQVVQEIADQNAQAISWALQSTVPDGGTPTAPTLQAARTYMNNRVTTRPQAVVLVTDGGPNCNSALNWQSCTCTDYSGQYCQLNENCMDDARAVQAVNQLATDGFATFVIGFPLAPVFSAVLDSMAVAGGTATNGAHSYYEATTQGELEAALRSLGERVANCRFELQEAPDANAVSVRVNGNSVSRDRTHNDGWDYVGVNTIEFFGPACDALDADGQVIVVDYCKATEG